MRSDNGHGTILAYHATNASVDFDRFGVSEDMGFHFGSIEAAHVRLKDLIEDDEDAVEFMRIIPCFLSISNPLRLDDCFTWGPVAVIGALLKSGLVSRFEADELAASGYFDEEMLESRLLRAGYDSVVYENFTEGGGDSYMVLDPDKIEFALSCLNTPRPAVSPRFK